MKILSLDTSTRNFSIAITDDEKILAAKEMQLDKILSDSIVPTIDRVLKETKTSLRQIDGFAVGLGPGSFTSLRVGLSTIKGFNFLNEKPVVGISSLDIIADNIGDTDKDIVVICDARREKVYSGIFTKSKGILKKKGEYQLTTIAELLKKIKTDAIFTGDALSLYSGVVKGASQKKYSFTIADSSLWYPKASQLAKLALTRFNKKKLDSVDLLTPIYLYSEYCQVQHAQKPAKKK